MSGIDFSDLVSGDKKKPRREPIEDDPWAIPGQTGPIPAAPSPGATHPGEAVTPDALVRAGFARILAVFVIGALVITGVQALKNSLTLTRDEAFAGFVQTLIEIAELGDRETFETLCREELVYDGPIGEGVTTQEELMAELLAAWDEADVAAIVLRDMEQAVVGPTGRMTAGFRVTLRRGELVHGFAADLSLEAMEGEEQWLVRSLSISDLRRTRNHAP